MKKTLPVILFVFFLSCTVEVDSPEESIKYTVTHSIIQEIVVPEVQVVGGGSLRDSWSDLGVYYFNSLNSKEESDVRLDNYIRYNQDVNRYMMVSGSAIADDSGYVNDTSSDKKYHSVIFGLRHVDSVDESDKQLYDYYTIPVDAYNNFSGYIYFKKPGAYKVYSFRNKDELLYSSDDIKSSTEISVNEEASTT